MGTMDWETRAVAAVLPLRDPDLLASARQLAFDGVPHRP